MPPRDINLGFMSMRNAALPARAAAAADAGFHGISLRADRWRAMQADGWDASRVRELLQTHRLVVSEIEPLRLLRDDLLDAALEMARAFDTPRIQVTPPIDGGRIDLEMAGAWLHRAANALAGTQLAVEFLPPTDVPDAPTALRLIELAGGAPNLGLCVDTWHVFRGGGLESLDGVDPARVFMIQVNDGHLRAAIPDYIEDCIRHRLPCGSGEFDLQAFMNRMPPGAPINVEVVSDALDQLAPSEVARILYDSTVAMLERCGCR